MTEIKHHRHGHKGRSHKRVQYCDVCSCNVPLTQGAASWEQHVAGIRHRRNKLSRQIHGDGSHVVMSIFETPPADGGPSPSRYKTKDPLYQAVPRTDAANPSALASTSQSAASATATLYNQLLRELIHHTGASKLYHRVAEKFSSLELGKAQQMLAGKLQQLKRWSNQYGKYRTLNQPLPMQLSPQELACFSQCCNEVSVKHLRLSVPYHPFGAEAAAYTTALCVLLASLQQHVWLQNLQLEFSKGDYMNILLQSGSAGLLSSNLVMLWGRVLLSLKQLTKANAALRFISLATPLGVVSSADVEDLQHALLDPASRHQLRLAVLMGTHSRLGQFSRLRLLPQPLLQIILDDAIPLSPCKFTWSLLEWLPGFDSEIQEDGGVSADEEDDAQSIDDGSNDDGSAASEMSSEQGSEDQDDDDEGGLASDVLAASMCV